jgi:large subunit ribosomal protein L28e
VHRLYKNIVSTTAKQGYRADLRREAVARASALRQASRPVKDTPEKKPRGAKAKAAATKTE